jgi:hypothetical protein
MRTQRNHTQQGPVHRHGAGGEHSSQSRSLLVILVNIKLEFGWVQVRVHTLCDIGKIIVQLLFAFK